MDSVEHLYYFPNEGIWHSAKEWVHSWANYLDVRRAGEWRYSRRAGDRHSRRTGDLVYLLDYSLD